MHVGFPQPVKIHHVSSPLWLHLAVSMLVLIFSFNLLLPPCFSDYFKFTSSVHSYSTRQSCNRNLYVTSVKTTQYGLLSLKFTGPRLFELLAYKYSITNSNSLRIFHKTFKNSILKLLLYILIVIICLSA